MNKVKERVLKEHEELNARTMKLEGFLYSAKVRKLNSEDRILLESQCSAMIQYRSILRARISRMNED